MGAQLLASRSLSFLAGRCLGEICHIVFLAISEHKLLGYMDGCVVPYSQSEAGIKEHCAASQQPAVTIKRSASQMPIADWNTAREGLRQILCMHGSVNLPNIKRHFHSYFQTELSETALGHSKLIELLQDDHLSDICVVTKDASGSYSVSQQLAYATMTEGVLSEPSGASSSFVPVALQLCFAPPTDADASVAAVEADLDGPSDLQSAETGEA